MLHDHCLFAIGDYPFEVIPGQQDDDSKLVLAGQCNVDKWGTPVGCSQITAATQWLNSKLYLFCDSLYFRFDPNSGMVRNKIGKPHAI